ncbi:MAG: efflux RND transporter permease subunit [Sphingopyxis sp.]|nr:efflux RND transporter permease subunit [Sphingopyxis sp.]
MELPKRATLTGAALANPRFVLITAIIVCLVGLIALLDFPATEEPSVTMRMATVNAYLPGESPERIEKAVARPLEEAIRAQSEVMTIDTQIRPGSVLIYVSLHENVSRQQVAAVWQNIRSRLAEVQTSLPAGTTEPRLNDDFGRVAVRTIAITGQGYSASQIELWAKHIRNQLQAVDGVATISLHGVRREVAYVELNPEFLRNAGTNAAAVARALSDREQLAPTGRLSQGGLAIAIQTGDRVRSASELAAIPIPTGQGVVPLGSLGTIRQIPQDPPEGGAYFNGKPSVVLGVSMANNLNVLSFANALDARLAGIQRTLPAGLHAETITDQASVVKKELKKVGQVFVETFIVVLAVVMIFLGWRSGLVTGTIVPMTVLGTAIVMMALGIELHQISIAAIIIALGIFVDNAIVVVEDYQRRLSDGEARIDAARAAGETMLTPLLVSSLAIIIAFVPLVAGETETGEYMRSLGVVLAITLLLSLLLALTVTPLLALRHIGADSHHDEDAGLLGRIKRSYGGLVTKILARPVRIVGGMVGLLATALVLLQFVPQELLAASARKQVQMPIELAPSATAEETMRTAARVSALLGDRRLFPHVTSHITYVADGGPRFILGLNPPSPTQNRAYTIINLDKDADLDAAIAHIDATLRPRFPQARFDTKRFFLGSSETGVAVFRLTGPDRPSLERAAERLQAKLEGIEGMLRVKSTLEAPLLRLTVSVDDAKVAAAGLSNAAVFSAINSIQDGSLATVVRDGDIEIPVVVRADRGDRATIERLNSLPVGPTQSGISLGSIARIDLADQASLLNRRDLLPMVEVTARHRDMTSQAIVDRISPEFGKLGLPADHRVSLGGEIEASAKASEGLNRYAPLALVSMFLLFLWQFGSFRKALIVLASMPFVAIGATLGLFLSGQPLSFTATIGILALMGIIVNNAVLLLGQIGDDRNAGMDLREAIAHSAELRLRPIVMTKLTCIAGLAPLFLFGGNLWRPMAAAMMGGLALGTLITLVLIPALYVIAFRGKSDDIPQPLAGETA